MSQEPSSRVWSVLGFVVGVVVAVAPSGCGALAGQHPGACSTTNCAGCCDSTGACQLNTSQRQCGFGGAACGVCAANQQCLSGVCAVSSGSGGGAGGMNGGAGGLRDGGDSTSQHDAGMLTMCNMTCSTCCDANGTCRPGTSTLECGRGGLQCEQCVFPASCEMGACKGGVVNGHDGGTGGGAGGGTGGGGGGGTGGGSGGGTGGGAGGGAGGGTGGGAGGGGGSGTTPGDTCATALALALYETTLVTQSQAGAATGNYQVSPCGETGTPQGTGPDMVFKLVLDTASKITLSAGGCEVGGLVVSLGSSCPSTSPLACGTTSGSLSLNTATSLAAGTYYVIVDTNAATLCSFYVDAAPTAP